MCPRSGYSPRYGVRSSQHSHVPQPEHRANTPCRVHAPQRASIPSPRTPLSPRTHPSPQGCSPAPSSWAHPSVRAQSEHRAHTPPHVHTSHHCTADTSQLVPPHRVPASAHTEHTPSLGLYVTADTQAHVSQCTQHTHSSPCPQVHATLPKSPRLHRDHVLLSSHIASG